MYIRPQRMVWRVLWLALLAGGIGNAGAQSVPAGERKHGICASCHGIAGRSFKSHYPILAGQAASYVLHQLHDFKQGRRSDSNMDAIVPQLSEEDMRDLAAFFASLKPYSSQYKSDAAKAVRGKEKAQKAGCAACHLRHAARETDQSSRIQGQHRDYMVKQLQDFRAGRRTNDAGVMRRIAQSLTDDDIDDLASYFAGIH